MGKLDKYTKKANISYLTGIMLGINAIPDTGVMVDGPDCLFFKSDIIYNNHDMCSDLKSVEKNHRIAYTGLTVNNVIKGHEKKVKKEFIKMKNDENISLIFSTTFPMAEVLGIQYDMVARDLGIEDKFIDIKGSIKKDWLDGYSELLLGLAKGLNLKNIKKEKKSVSIVGNLFHRNEGDSIGNVIELERILEKIGLKVHTIWLNGKDTTNLRKIEESEYIISLPYGRKAAKKVAELTGAKLIETVLPFSIESTNTFIIDISKSIDLNEIEIGKVIKEENDYVLNRISFFIKDIFMDKNISFVNDPNLIEGFISFSHILGFELGTIVGISNSKNRKDKIMQQDIRYGVEFAHIDISENSLVIKNSIHSFYCEEIDLGFPNTTNHFFYDFPYLGYRGALNFVNILINYYLKPKFEDEE